MRAVGWGIAALTLLATAATLQAQPPRGKGMPENWWNDWFGTSKSKPLDDPSASGAAKQLSPEDRTRELDRLEKAMLRREAVCSKLQEVAEATGNAALREEALRLLEATYALHKGQVRALGGLMPQAPPAEEDAGPVTLPPVSRDLMEPLPARYRSGGMEAGVTVPSRSLEGQR